MFSGFVLDPPLDQGKMWSKCRLLVAPHCTHRILSRFKTASLTSVGISRPGEVLTCRFSSSISTGPSTRWSSKTQTFRVPDPRPT
jgi:hypothetical protein